MNDSSQKSAYQVLALKWRPKNFSELIGQESVERTLTNAIKQNRLYPVLIFTGPRGTGKTSTARIIAKAIRCLDPKDGMSCNVCEECLLIQEGKNLDVIEIDGASNNGVDAIRELRETVNYLPSQGSKKIYIIDEVHMLSNSAFNALLKTLEEPPSHVLFIMATTESHKIPQTVMSRAQRLDFNLISPLLIKEQLEKICKNEKISLDDQSLWLIAKQAQGSLRDAQSLLDQMITFCGSKITADKIVEILGLADLEIVYRCVQAILARNEQDMLAVLKDIHSKGLEPRLVLQELISNLRNLIVLKLNPDNQQNLIQSSQQEIDQWKQLIAENSYEELHFLFDMLLKGEQEILFSSDSRMVLEILLLRLCQAPTLEMVTPFSFEKSSDPIPVSKTKTLNIKLSEDHNETSSSANVSSIKKKVDLKVEDKPEPAEASAEETLTETTIETSEQNPAESISVSQLISFIEKLKTKDHVLSSVFSQLMFKEQQGNKLIFLISESFNYGQNKLEDPKIKSMLEKTFNDFLKTDQIFSFQFEVSSGDLSISLMEQKDQKIKDEFIETVSNDSFVKTVTEVFDATIGPIEK